MSRADDEKFVNLLVALADEYAAKVVRLHTVNSEIADNFVSNYLDDSEVAFAVWMEKEGKRVCSLCIRQPIGEPSSDGIAAVWVEDRTTAEALKKKMEERQR
jgi:hypothetical protein